MRKPWARHSGELGPVTAGAVPNLDNLWKLAAFDDEFALIRAEADLPDGFRDPAVRASAQLLLDTCRAWLDGARGQALRSRGVRVVAALSKASGVTAYSMRIEPHLGVPFMEVDRAPVFLVRINAGAVLALAGRTSRWLRSFDEPNRRTLARILDRELGDAELDRLGWLASWHAAHALFLHEMYHIARGHLWPSAYWGAIDQECALLDEPERDVRRAIEDDADRLAAVDFLDFLSAEIAPDPAPHARREAFLRAMLGLIALFDALAAEQGAEPSDCYHCPTVRARVLVAAAMTRFGIDEDDHASLAALATLLDGDAQRHGLDRATVERDLRRWERTDALRRSLEAQGAFSAFLGGN